MSLVRERTFQTYRGVSPFRGTVATFAFESTT